VNVRLAALERALGRDGNDPAFEAIVEKLCDVAAEQTDAACTWTRAQLEDAAAKELTAVRARAKADLDRVPGGSRRRDGADGRDTGRFRAAPGESRRNCG
jgi:hypothetical protein